jgi:hypothetical protein
MTSISNSINNTLSGATINNSVIGTTVPAAGVFTTLSATSGLNSTAIGASFPEAGSFTTLSASSGLDTTIIGANTPENGTFTTLTATTEVIVNGGTGNNSPIAFKQGSTTLFVMGYNNADSQFLLSQGGIFGNNNIIIADSNGGQHYGHQNNSAPSAGYIGEQIRATLGQGSATGLTTGDNANVCSINITAGVWDVSGICGFTGITTGTGCQLSISTSSATAGTAGDNFVALAITSLTSSDTYISIPSYRISTSSTIPVYLVALANYSAGTGKAYGRISATRVG